MKTFFDTSLLIASVVAPHPMFGRAKPWMDRAQGGEFEWFVGAHSLAEMYAVLTAAPWRPRIGPQMAREIVRDNVERFATVVPLSAADYATTLDSVAALGGTSGIVYDALLARAAQNTGAERLLTFNPAHFARVWPAGAAVIMVP